MRHAARRDANEPEIIAAFAAHGARAWTVSDGGRPDLAVWHRDRWHLVEVKMPKGALTDAQVKFIREVEDNGGRVHVVRTVEDVAAIVRGWENDV